MTLSPQDAAAALRDINQAETRTRELQGYEYGGPFLIVWGVAWLVAGTLSFVFREQMGSIWNTINLIAVAATVWLLFRARGAGHDRGKSLRIFASGLVFAALATATVWLFQPTSPLAIGVFIGLVVSAAYILMGLWLGARYIVAGALTAAILIGAYLFMPAHFLLWMGVVGGGSMIVCGIWMARA